MAEITKEIADSRFKSFDITSMSKEEIYKKLMPELTPEEIDTAFFCFIFSSFLEKKTTNMLQGLIKNFSNKNLYDNEPGVKEWLNSVVDELHFMGKIKLIRKASAGAKTSDQTPNRYKKYLAFMEKINNLRNEFSHGRLKDLKYGEDSILSIKIKQKMVDDLFETIRHALTGADVK